MPASVTPQETRASYAHGASATPLMGLTIGAVFERTVSTFSDNDALVVPYQGVRWNYAELGHHVDEAAAGLVSLGLEPGDRIGIWAPNMAEWVVLQFASAKAGLILVNINPAYRLSELEYALNQVEAKALVLLPRFKSSNYAEMLTELMPELSEGSPPGQLKAKRVPSLKWVITLADQALHGAITYKDVLARADDRTRQTVRELAEVLQFDDPINIQFTSGTTGKPKAATLTHHNIVNNAYFTGVQMRLTHRDRMCIPVPMYHCFGMVLGTLCCVAHGATMVFASAGFDAEAAMAVTEAERCTVFHGVPTMFIAALDTPGFADRDLSHLRTGIIAGAPCPVELMKRIMDEMHMTEITIAYGMTETGPVSTQTSVDDPVYRRVETVGRVLPHTEIKIVDTEGRITPRGVAGELLTRGYCVMLRYWNDPEKTATAIDEARWIASGDIAMMDDEGYVQIVGRIKDMLIRGGENIFPREIEDFLYTHPAIEQVEVIGAPDEKYGEEVCAWIKLREGHSVTEEAIRDFCRGKIAHFKIPRYIRFVDEFPLTATGKVQKFVMREIMARELKKKAH
ncbi:AMP-binding protein [Ruegeria marisrubri]|uniref:3-methylmercaptopropionyl-CoA ligase n=1 Tax=Ruegeria marisrubri TaxID=1685379 RepID=A0A0X3UBN2_9RHOB|nr:AMP-binding protein [Ruegeria marisrubri]KUJ85497.1 AMP-binding protein [Ruegeria marisrubri]